MDCKFCTVCSLDSYCHCNLTSMAAKPTGANFKEYWMGRFNFIYALSIRKVHVAEKTK